MIMIKHCFALLTLMCINIEKLSSLALQEERCTRRFTAGYCFEHVRPVWTFVFQYQNCDIRMGCPPSPRVNRFPSYASCMKRCKLLLDVYSQLVMGNDTSIGTYLRSRSWGKISTLCLKKTSHCHEHCVKRSADLSRRENNNKLTDNRNDAEDAIDSIEYEVMVPDSYHANYYENTEQAPEDIFPVNIDEDTETHRVLDVLN